MQSYPSRVLRLGVEQSAKLLGFYPIDRIDSMYGIFYLKVKVRLNLDLPEDKITELVENLDYDFKDCAVESTEIIDIELPEKHNL